MAFQEKYHCEKVVKIICVLTDMQDCKEVSICMADYTINYQLSYRAIESNGSFSRLHTLLVIGMKDFMDIQEEIQCLNRSSILVVCKFLISQMK